MKHANLAVLCTHHRTSLNINDGRPPSSEGRAMRTKEFLVAHGCICFQKATQAQKFEALPSAIVLSKGGVTRGQTAPPLQLPRLGGTAWASWSLDRTHVCVHSRTYHHSIFVAVSKSCTGKAFCLKNVGMRTGVAFCCDHPCRMRLHSESTGMSPKRTVMSCDVMQRVM